MTNVSSFLHALSICCLMKNKWNFYSWRGEKRKTNKVDFNASFSFGFVFFCAIYKRNNLFSADISLKCHEREKKSLKLYCDGWFHQRANIFCSTLEISFLLFCVRVFLGRSHFRLAGKWCRKSPTNWMSQSKLISFCPIYWFVRFDWVIKKRKLGYYLIEDVGIDDRERERETRKTRIIEI